jgi:hypothetical protein
MLIDKRFVDVDFRAEPQFVFGDTGRAEQKCAGFRAYEDVEDIIPRSQWKELADHIDNTPNAGIESCISRVFNQSQEGSCVGNATTQQNETLQGKLFGKENVTLLSAISLYQLIGSSAQSGANVADAMDAASDTGTIPLDTPENRQRFGNIVMPHTGFRTHRPEGWQPIAKQFRINERLVIKTFDGLITAGLKGHAPVVGRAGHSILYLRPHFNGNTLLYLYVNSWLGWGQAMAGHDHGFGFDTERYIQSSAGWAFATRSLVIPDHLHLAA